jgi:WD40 repeat protein
MILFVAITNKICGLRMFLKKVHWLIFPTLFSCGNIITSTVDQKQSTATYCANSYVTNIFRQQCITQFTRTSQQGCTSQRLLRIPDKLWQHIFAWLGHNMRKWHEARSISFPSAITCITKLTDQTCAVACDDHIDRMKDYDIHICDIKQGDILTTLKVYPGEHTGAIQSLAYLQAHHMLASGSNDHTIKLWNISTGKCLRTLTGHWHYVYPLVALPDGNLASASGDGTIKIWDPLTGDCLHTMQVQVSNISLNYLAALPNNRLAAIVDHERIEIWDWSIQTRMSSFHGSQKNYPASSFHHRLKRRTHRTDKTQRSNVYALSVLPNENLAVGLGDGTINIVDADTGECLKKLHGHLTAPTSRISSLAVLTDGSLVSGADDHSIRIWNPLSGECLHKSKKWAQEITSLAVMADDTLITISKNDTLKVLQAQPDFGVNLEEEASPEEWLLVSSSASSNSSTCSS